ncbi:MAG TPA: hypothetical protein VH280_10960 [Verrucomicrobiae bacterium]|nr:hypothetical protein [Verrucomicrobiae bacterium]
MLGVTLTKELHRVLKKTVDLKSHPVTADETMFVIFVIFQLYSALRFSNQKLVVDIGDLRKDAKDFFSLPIPRAVWEEKKGYQNRILVNFVESALSGG